MDMEQIAGIIIFSILGIPGVIFGIVLFCGKGADLIAGYNSLSAKEREKWNEKALCAALDHESGRFEDKPHVITLAPGEKKELTYRFTLL